jgi:hypothetical protein
VDGCERLRRSFNLDNKIKNFRIGGAMKSKTNLIHNFFLYLIIYFCIFITITLLIPDLLPITIILAAGISLVITFYGEINKNKFIEIFGLFSLCLVIIFVVTFMWYLFYPDKIIPPLPNVALAIGIDIVIIFLMCLQYREFKKSI